MNVVTVDYSPISTKRREPQGSVNTSLKCSSEAENHDFPDVKQSEPGKVDLISQNFTIKSILSTLAALEASLLNTSGNVPLHNRFRALFTLKAFKNDDAVNIISKGFADESALLKHELAYCLGQMKNKSALPILESVLSNEKENPMVRHEVAAESSLFLCVGGRGLGCHLFPTSIAILKQYASDPERSVRETCEIALDKIEWDNSEEGKKHWSSTASSAEQMYTSIDPAPPRLIFCPAKPRPRTGRNQTSKI
ncbi:Deoxyhypusine hydroxylase [Grifola frondosa]|uniref:Deoxyhypusine hydroxylase n=1 Tax=Grifola frondosa TaxID=5627 RepID=A0A1C7LVN8_GRIFR|nr:Deoxyhypusine hydroxylase [Grifola frondosa]